MQDFLMKLNHISAQLSGWLALTTHRGELLYHRNEDEDNAANTIFDHPCLNTLSVNQMKFEAHYNYKIYPWYIISIVCYSGLNCENRFGDVIFRTRFVTI